MTTPPLLTNRTALVQHRVRATNAPALFLQDAAATEIKERLSEVNKTFTQMAIVTGWPGVWDSFSPDNMIIEDEDHLSLTSGAHDLVVHALSLHWANDPVGQLVQCRRALCPDGLFLATLFGGETLTELRQALAYAETQVMGGLSPRIAPMGEIRDLGGLLHRAGFAMPVADVTRLTVTYGGLRSLMQDLRAMGETNALANRLAKPVPRRLFDLAEAQYRAHHATEDGRLKATFDIVTLTGWAPADTQPKPLRPGSATTRLADALGTTEHRENKSKE